MPFNPLIRLATLACFTAASAIPATYISSDGQLLNTTSLLSSRATPLYIFCKCGLKLNVADTNAAVAKITSGPEIDMPAFGANWQQSGNMVAFACALGNSVNINTRQYTYDVQTLVTSVCGQWTAGAVFHSDSNFVIGYMDAPFTQDRCTQAKLIQYNSVGGTTDDLRYRC